MPWQIIVVILSDLVVTGISTWGLIVLRENIVWDMAIIAVVLAWAIYGVVWWGLWKGSKWGLWGKAILVLLQVIEWPYGTVIGIVQGLLLLSGGSRKHFMHKGRMVRV